MKSLVTLLLILAAALFSARYSSVRPWAEWAIALWLAIAAYTLWEKWREPSFKDREDSDWLGLAAWAVMLFGPLVGGWFIARPLGSRWYAFLGTTISLLLP